MKKLLLLLAIFTLANVAQAQVELPNTISNSDKVYGLSKFWQETNYNFVYLYKLDKEVLDDEYRRLISEVQLTNNDYEYYRMLERFCAMLEDGHTNVFYPESVENCLTSSFGEYNFKVKNIDNRAIITNVSINKKEEVPIGSEIIEVNGMPTKQYLDECVKPYVCSSTDYVRENTATSRIFKAPIGTEFLIKVRKANSNENIVLNLTSEISEDPILYPEIEQRPILEYCTLDHDIAYLALNGFDDPKIIDLFEAKLPEIKRAKRLIIDLRYNGGGDGGIGRHILKHFTQDSLITISKSRTRKNISTYKAWSDYIKPSDTLNMSQSQRDLFRDAVLIYEDNLFHEFPHFPSKNKIPQDDRLVIPTVVLVSNNTASAAEDFLVSADTQTHFTKIGERSNGSTGQPLLLNLPKGGSARICTKDDTYPDGRAFVGVGITPNILIKQTLADFMNNRDVVLERAIEHLKDK